MECSQLAATEISLNVPEMTGASAPLARVARLFTPALCVFFILGVLSWLFMAGPNGWSSLLADADTGWHIRTGETILREGHVPHQDLFSFSKAGQPWFAWEWLSDVIFALAFRTFGFKGIVLLAGVLVALFALLLLEYTLWRGANAFMALGVTLLAVGAATIHFLARPHLFTLVLFVASVWLLDADRRRHTRAVWILPALTILWTNLHGGFVILPVWLAALAVSAAIEGIWNRPALREVKRYAALFAACCAATLINPYGYRLHEHLFAYLRSDWIRNVVQEFQAPTFRGESQFQFELLLIGGIAAAALALARRDVATAVTVALMAHMALTSARHIPLFVVAATPAIAMELTRLWRQVLGPRARSSMCGIVDQLALDVTGKLRRISLLAPAAVLVLLLLPIGLAWPTDFAGELFPIHLAHTEAAVLKSGRLFTTDQWADYLIFHYWPDVHVFLDGRTDFYGRELGTEYIELLHGEPQWRRVLTKYAFTAVLVPPDMPLAALLREDSGWRVTAEDKKAVLFLRRTDQGVSPRNASGELRTGITQPVEPGPDGDGTEVARQPNGNVPGDRHITQETRAL